MATEVETAFVLLRATAEAAGENEFLSREVGVPGVQAALDQEGRKHLLLAVDTGADVPTDVKSAGVHLLPGKLAIDGATQTVAMLRCVDGSLDLVFDHLADDVVSRITTTTVAPLAAARECLDEWRAMLRHSSDLTSAQVVGICAELEVLLRIGRDRPREALDCWTGPTGTIHDFVHGSRAIEVKGTALREGQSVTIHGLDQLDPGEQDELHLAVAHCIGSPTAPSLDERIRTLIAAGFSRTELLDKIQAAGYTFESPTSIPTRYDIRTLRLWTVGADFPGLRRSALPDVAQAGVSQVQFTLNLDAAPSPSSDPDMEGALSAWMT